jgi:hypothetical protein
MKYMHIKIGKTDKTQKTLALCKILWYSTIVAKIDGPLIL